MTLETMTLGALLGYLAGSAPSPEVINDLREKKPEFYDIIDIDLSTARDNQEYTKSGTFIWIDNQFARGLVTLRLNEPTFKQLDLRRQKYISGPFYRFFITNVAGQGVIKLFISRGYQAASEPIEAINRAELAARLGSIVTFDRRGDLIWMDDFESGIQKWDVDSGTAIWTADHCRTGGFSVKLATGAVYNNEAFILAHLALPVLGKIGIETAFTLSGNHAYVQLTGIIYDGTNMHIPSIRIDVAAEEIQYRNSDGYYVSIGNTGKLSTTDYMFYVLKLVFDTSLAQYERVIFGSTEWSLSGLTYFTFLDSTEPSIVLGVGSQNNGDVAAINYFDCAILTQNEP